MHLWRKMRKVWVSVSATLKPHKQSGGASSGNGSGLLKLQDDVNRCGYKDVQVMWNLLINASHIRAAGSSGKCSNNKQRSCRQDHIQLKTYSCYE